jgi:hypothetical protein
MGKAEIGSDLATEADDFSLALPEPVVLATAATQAVAGGVLSISKPGLGCCTCGILQPFPVRQVNL